ncbi:MAG: hypothetical protein HY437_01785 [Candidatus Magasanikbacteria bacterium]|nr:hypothetical protein [Candidatus Magasanikbacteria bacterium]
MYFGSWRKAIEATGLTYDDVRVLHHVCPVWSKEKIIVTIKEMHGRKQPLNYYHVETKKPRLLGAAVTHFGGWAQAIDAAGLDYSKLRKWRLQRSWSKTAIVTEVIRRANEGLSIRGNDIFREDQGLYKAAMQHFGKRGWAKARVLAGFDPIDPRPDKIWNKQTIRQEILRLIKNGIALNTSSLEGTAYNYIIVAGHRVFGSWAKAIRAAGLDYGKIRKGREKGWWTKPRIIMCIRNLEKRGFRLSHSTLRNTHRPLLEAARMYFGSWSQAVEAAGISYRRHCRVWSPKAWLRRMEENEYQELLESAETLARKRRKK